MSIFKSKGFDSIISKDVVIVGEMVLNGTCVIDGTFKGPTITSDQNKSAGKDMLMVNGNIDVIGIQVDNLTIIGNVTCKAVRVEGVLAVQATAKLTAEVIYYRTMKAEPGAIIQGQLKHLDHCSEGEQV